MTVYISLEDHFLSKASRESNGGTNLSLESFPEEVRYDFVEIGPHRISKMSQANVAVQVISHTPILGSLSVCQRSNDELAAAVRAHPDQLRGFAMLPMASPAAVPSELRRCVHQLGFLGCLVPNHAEGVYYDKPEYSTLFQTAEELDVPIYLHPSPASTTTMHQFAGNYPADVQFALSAHAWDWHADCGLHFLRLYAAGIFDQYPRVKIILGHLGEMLPFMLGRIEQKLSLTAHVRDLKASISQVYARNVWITTSGMLQVAPFVCALQCTNIERIMFSVDYPFESNIQSVRFMEQVKTLGILNEREMELVARGNAQRLLGIKIPAETIAQQSSNMRGDGAEVRREKATSHI